MMQDCGGGKYSTPTAKGLERIWNRMIYVKKFVTAVTKLYKPNIRREAKAAP